MVWTVEVPGLTKIQGMKKTMMLAILILAVHAESNLGEETVTTLPMRLQKLPDTVRSGTTSSITHATPQICDIETPSPEVWKAHNISGFLDSYPHANTTSVSEFARQNGVFNFVCGIGETCDAGQICAPVAGPVWHVLYAVQQWNHVQESFNKAISFAASTLSIIGSKLAIDLYPPEEKKVKHLFKVSYILSLVVAIVATISAVLMVWCPGVNVVAMGVAGGLIGGAVATAQASTTIAAQKAFNALKSDAFSRSASFTEAISQWEQGMQKKLADDMNRALTAGINSPDGFGPLLADGKLFINTLDKTTYDIEKSLEDVVKRRMINSILLEKKAFVTVNSDECNQGGPDGAFKSEDGWLSWCKDGKMMNIIYANGDKAGNQLYNAGMIPMKYGITVEYMTTQSENCQLKYGGYSHDPYKDGPLPSDINADCIFNLPVCYPSADKSIRKKRRKHGTVVACREKAALPI